jgi:hypothetical protein
MPGGALRRLIHVFIYVFRRDADLETRGHFALSQTGGLPPPLEFLGRGNDLALQFGQRVVAMGWPDFIAMPLRK